MVLDEKMSEEKQAPSSSSLGGGSVDAGGGRGLTSSSSDGDRRKRMSDISGDDKSRKKHVEVVDHPTFDLSTYAARYSGATKVRRLQFIAERCPKFAIDAYNMAISEAKQGIDIELYQEVVTSAQDRYDSAFSLDTNWLQSVMRKNQEQQQFLEQNLVSQKQNMIRDRIREAYAQLADFHFRRGDYQAALAKYVETKDHVSKPEQQLEMSLSIIKTSILLSTMSHVKTEVSRVLAMDNDVARLDVVTGKAKASLGLYYLKNKNFLMAAKNFHEAKPRVAGQYKEVMSGEDIALYGVLCALASCPRRTLKKDILDNEKFKTFLEPLPVLRGIIYDFYHSRYASCIAALERIKPDMKLDIYLALHVEQLFKSIRDKALIQYFSPFSSVDMRKMAEAFNMSVNALEDEVANLIIEGKIQARIDSHQKVLYRKHTDQRSATFKQAIRVGERYIHDTKAMLLRMSLVQYDFVVRDEGREADDDEGYFSDDMLSSSSTKHRGAQSSATSSSSSTHCLQCQCPQFLPDRWKTHICQNCRHSNKAHHNTTGPSYNDGDEDFHLGGQEGGGGGGGGGGGRKKGRTGRRSGGGRKRNK